MINCVVSDLIKNSEETINLIKPANIEQVRKCGKSLIIMSDSIIIMHNALKKYLRLNLYQHERVMSMSNKAKKIVRFLFNAYLEDKNLLNLARKCKNGDYTEEFHTIYKELTFQEKCDQEFSAQILKSHPFKIILIQLSNWHEFFNKRMFTPNPEKSFPIMHNYISSNNIFYL